MSAPVPAETIPEQERTTLLIAYVLHIVAPFTFWTAAVVGVIIDHLKVGETQNDFIRSHHRWLIHTFWWGLLGLVIAVSTFWLLGLGYLVYIALSIWWLFRVVRGVLAFSERRPMPMD